HARLFVNLGRRDGMKADALREALAELGGILPEDIAHVELRSRHALVSVHDDFAEDLIEAVNGETLGRRTVRIEFAEAD
ncbi:MAG: DbpA RNA binding domain-containing protein, partial [Myxococcales bacterium]|nr:DbpA RNA binding domain-containing protein [Myxococcales bacterium]